MTFTAAEIAEILSAHVLREHNGSVKPDEVRFDIEPAYPSNDPRENKPNATLTGATVPVSMK